MAWTICFVNYFVKVGQIYTTNLLLCFHANSLSLEVGHGVGMGRNVLVLLPWGPCLIGCCRPSVELQARETSLWGVKWGLDMDR